MKVSRGSSGSRTTDVAEGSGLVDTSRIEIKTAGRNLLTPSTTCRTGRRACRRATRDYAWSPRGVSQPHDKGDIMSTARGNRWMAFALVALILGGPRAATAGVTSILLNSDPGDYIGGGQTLIFTSADGSFFAQSYGNGSSVTVSFNTPTLTTFGI
jgi:hypothetical protein